MSKRRGEQKLNAFELGGDAHADVDDVADEIYGASAPSLKTGVIRSKPIPINKVRPDRAQPRRAIPLIVMGQWDGSPDAIPELIALWYEGAVNQYGKRFDVKDCLLGRKSLELTDDAGAILVGFNKLINLAASIRNEGLTNPITVVRDGAGYMIETGERRYLAHHLLNMYLDDGKWDHVIARVVEFDLFRQASENNARDSLNAIQMARQVALLIMAERGHMDGHDYASYDELVLAGESDRRFYAQVANGNVHRIPAGSGDKISNAVGLSMARISQYRRLLRVSDDEALNDKIWLEADTNDWSEGYIREYVQTLTAVKVAEPDTPSPQTPLPDGEGLNNSSGVTSASSRFGRFGEPARPLRGSTAYDNSPSDAPLHVPTSPAQSDATSNHTPPVTNASERPAENNDIGLRKVDYDESLVNHFGIGRMVALVRHLADDVANQDLVNKLTELEATHMDNLGDMKPAEFREYQNQLMRDIGALLNFVASEFYAFGEAWNQLDSDARNTPE